MILKSRSEKTFEEADAMLDKLIGRYQEEMDGYVDRRGSRAHSPEVEACGRSNDPGRGESTCTLLGPELEMVKRFFREGQFFTSDEERMALLLKLTRDAEALLDRASPPD